MKKYFNIFLFTLFAISAVKAKVDSDTLSFSWNIASNTGRYTFENEILENNSELAYGYALFELPQPKIGYDVQVTVLDSFKINKLGNSLCYPKTVLLKTYDKKQFVSVLKIYPTYTIDGEVWGVKKCKITFIPNRQAVVFGTKESGRSFSNKSKLSEGIWAKIAVTKIGIYKIDRSFLQNLGLNVLNPKNLHVYGIKGGMLPSWNNAPRTDDLTELPIKVVGEQDEVFDQNDYVLFWADGADNWTFNPSNKNFYKNINIFTDTSYFFIHFDNEPGLRWQKSTPVVLPNTHTTSTGDGRTFIYAPKYNLLRSGQSWWTDQYDLQTQYSYGVDLQNLETNEPIRLRMQTAGRNIGGNGVFTVSVNQNNPFLSTYIGAVSGTYLDYYALDKIDSTNFLVNNGQFNLTLNYAKSNANCVGFLGWIALVYREKLFLNNSALPFRDSKSIGIGNITKFEIENASEATEIINITNIFNIKSIPFDLTGSKASFLWPTDSLEEFCAINGANHPSPIGLGIVNNQNLHGLPVTELIIVCPDRLIPEAERLANFKISKGISSVVVTPQQIYNEFSGGRMDLIAFRDFFKMQYERSTASNALKYVLLFGDGSFDYKNLRPGNENLIPTYESPESLSPTASFATDAYIAVLDDNEGVFENGDIDRMDIAIGRLPIASKAQADATVNKIIVYSTSTSFGDWRNYVTMIADDVDNNTHVNQAETLGDRITRNAPEIILDKIYFDAYKRVSVPGGVRYPDVNTAINNAVSNGRLIVNYTGHGGVTGLAEERVCTNIDINSWNNIQKLPFFVTATCEFSRFDDPDIYSSGEQVINNLNGGAIGMFTTVRLTWSGENFSTALAFYSRHLLEKDSNGLPLPIGEIVRRTLNESLSSVNTRSYVLFGDPSLRLAFPRNDVGVTAINNITVNSSLDTIKALEEVTIEGEITDKNGNLLADFNGTCIPTVFDKPRTVSGLRNDPLNPPFSFKVKNAVIYKGRVSVSGGKFNFKFIVPKDIGYNFGLGSISLYAYDTTRDASGNYDSIMVGGSSSVSLRDDIGPEIKLFMNDTLFKNGGFTNENPILLAQLFDSSGINTVGNGIGRDLMAVLDNKTLAPIALNNYYEASLNSFQEGKVVYPFTNLTEGDHNLKLTAWDVNNNFNEAEINFTVKLANSVVVKSCIAYPNPFTDLITFNIQYNQANVPVNAILRISDLQGRTVLESKQTLQSGGFSNNQLTWDGKTIQGEAVNGMYLATILLDVNGSKQTPITLKVLKNR